MGWLTVACYFGVSILAALASYRAFGRQRAFWFTLSLVLFALAINKQLDLQSALTAVGRCVAQAQGWYAERRSFQFRFIIFLMVASTLVALLLFLVMRRELGHLWLALAGISLLLTFIAIRAVGFHHFDGFISHEIGSVRMNWALEIGGIAMIGVNALYLILRGFNAETMGGSRKR